MADPKTRMWSYLSWDLPGRCETISERLFEKSLLAAQALGITIEDPSEVKKPPAKAEAPAPVAATQRPEPATASLRGLQ